MRWSVCVGIYALPAETDRIVYFMDDVALSTSASGGSGSGTGNGRGSTAAVLRFLLEKSKLFMGGSKPKQVEGASHIATITVRCSDQNHKGCFLSSIILIN